MKFSKKSSDNSDKPKKVKKSKIVFSEEIDNRLGTISLVITFILIGLLLLLCPDYFGDKNVHMWCTWAFVIVGTIGLFVEMDSGEKIHGFTNVVVGSIFLAIWFWLYYCGVTSNILVAVALLLASIFGVYAIVLGIIQVIYSFWYCIRFAKKSKTEFGWSDIILFCTKVASLALIVLQIIKLCLGE